MRILPLILSGLTTLATVGCSSVQVETYTTGCDWLSTSTETELVMDDDAQCEVTRSGDSINVRVIGKHHEGTGWNSNDPHWTVDGNCMSYERETEDSLGDTYVYSRHNMGVCFDR